MDKNLISVNIIAHNAERTLKKTLESVKAQLEVSFEIIFVNDASTDGTSEIIHDFKNTNPLIPCAIFTNQYKQGIAKSRNRALSHSRGNFIAILDSDDTWSDPYKLRKQLDFLNQNPDHILVGTQIHVVDSNGIILKTTQYKTEDDKIKNKMLVLNQLAHSSILMRRINHTYNEFLPIWEDYDFFLELGTHHKLANIDEPMVNYLYAPKKYSLEKKIQNTTTEIRIIKKFKNLYPNFWFGYLKGILKYILILIRLK